MHLRGAFGFPGEFRGIEPMATAARFRVAYADSRCTGGLRVQRRAAALRRSIRHSTDVARGGAWAGWYRNSALLQLDDTIGSLREDHGITAEAVEGTIAPGVPRPWPAAVARKIARSFQRTVVQQLRARTPYDAEGRVRCNLARFGHLDRRQAARCLKRLQQLSSTTPPRVWAASFGAIWNRWATARRCQSACSHCLLGCEFGTDALEHYGRCPIVYRFAKSQLHLSFRFSTCWEYWNLVAPDDADTDRNPSWWPRFSLLHFAVLKTTNAARRRGRLCPAEAARALQQAAIEGARGHHLAAAWRQASPWHLAQHPGGQALTARTAIPQDQQTRQRVETPLEMATDQEHFASAGFLASWYS